MEIKKIRERKSDIKKLTKDFDIPEKIEGISVERSGEVSHFLGERWQGMRPVDECIERYWEFSHDSGRIIDMSTVIYGEEVSE